MKTGQMIEEIIIQQIDFLRQLNLEPRRIQISDEFRQVFNKHCLDKMNYSTSRKKEIASFDVNTYMDILVQYTYMELSPPTGCGGIVFPTQVLHKKIA